MQRYAIISNPKAPCWIFNKFLTQSPPVPTEGLPMWIFFSKFAVD